MIVIAGILFGVFSFAAAYFLHGGSIGIFFDAWTEFIAIGGGAFGIFLAGNGVSGVKNAIAGLLHLLKPDPYSKKAFTDLLVMLYQIFSVARRDGLLGLESHLEDPKKSTIMSKNHTFLHDHHAVEFFCDTLKVIVSGGVQPHSLDEMMEIDIEATHKAESMTPDALQNVGDAMPAVGIVACILGVVITMGKIGGDPLAIGHAIGIALIGTLLGIFAAYVVMFPAVRAMAGRHVTSGAYVACIRQAVFSFARGEPPVTCIEFARRCIDPALRPGFDELDKAVKAAKNG